MSESKRKSFLCGKIVRLQINENFIEFDSKTRGNIILCLCSGIE